MLGPCCTQRTPAGRLGCPPPTPSQQRGGGLLGDMGTNFGKQQVSCTKYQGEWTWLFCNVLAMVCLLVLERRESNVSFCAFGPRVVDIVVDIGAWNDTGGRTRNWSDRQLYQGQGPPIPSTPTDPYPTPLHPTPVSSDRTELNKWIRDLLSHSVCSRRI